MKETRIVELVIADDSQELAIDAISLVTSPAIEQDAYLRTADCYFMLKEYAKANTLYDNVINNALAQGDYALFQKGFSYGLLKKHTKKTEKKALTILKCALFINLESGK